MSQDRPTPSGPAAPELTIVESRVYRGGNVWSYDPAIHLVVDLGILEEYPTDLLDGFTDHLLELLPGIENHTCSRGVKGGFVQRLREGTWLGHVSEHVALQLQQEAGHDQRRGKTRMVKGQPGRYNVIYGYSDEGVGMAAGRLAVRLVNNLVRAEEGFDFREELDTFLRRADRTAFGPSTAAILEEAVSRDIPYIRLNSASLVQLGQGVHAQRIRATMTSKTGALAVDIASDKDLTTKLLGSAGLPVPKQETVRGPNDAVAAARRVGYPVVLKPLDGNHGRGVCLDLQTDDEVREAFHVAREQSRRGNVIVESFITGKDYRCLIVGGRMQAIAERVPAHVVGDGEHTVAELVDITNSDPRRGVGHEKVLTRIKVDAAAEQLVHDQGFAMDEVPPQGTMVKLALTGNMSTGGISVDRTFDAHPDNVEIAEEAARMVGLDVAGIDFICPDIASPVRETGGAICEVNAAPGFRMHTHPTIGEPQFIAKPVVDLLFPPGAPSRVPIVAVTGTNGKTTTSRMIAHIMKGVGRKVGMTSTDGIVVDERLVFKADASGPKSARMVLQNPRVDFAVMEVARGGILREGLGYDRNDVAVVTNVAPDHLGLRGIETVEQLADVKAVVVEAVPRNGFAVLNADDALVRKMRRRCSGSIVWFTTSTPGTAVRDFVDEHCRRGGRAVVLEPSDKGDMIVIRHGRRSMQLAWTHLLPSTFGGTAMFNVSNAMAAAGAAFAIGTGLHEIRQGLRTFSTSYYLSPGRMNQVNVNNVDVIVDYCHNAPGMKVLGEFVERYAEAKSGATELGKLSRLGVIATAGDRRDADMRELGTIAAQHFDVIVVREDERLRGRKPGETAGLVAEGAKAAMADGARCRQVEIVTDELSAVRHVMARANPGDIVVVCVDQHGVVMNELETMTKQAQPGTHTAGSVADPDLDPTTITAEAHVSGEEATGQGLAEHEADDTEVGSTEDPKDVVDPDEAPEAPQH
ncbi:cyanophycin synthetase [Knoellia subterranea]|uniref:Cyanophycin synthetase n=1 Tax=Knoellia subterranea KCTC 19937 TaxID=1385521 RepID=A0A0A0JMR3_9MICO|nr:cyanophycin synthetase [Knoellia subterranea]KGN38730.1 cyanophycin synthetase [Knoellia subterranea KCTC 19937]